MLNREFGVRVTAATNLTILPVCSLLLPHTAVWFSFLNLRSTLKSGWSKLSPRADWVHTSLGKKDDRDLIHFVEKFIMKDGRQRERHETNFNVNRKNFVSKNALLYCLFSCHPCRHPHGTYKIIMVDLSCFCVKV